MVCVCVVVFCAQLMWCTGVYIPTSQLLLEVVHHPYLAKQAKGRVIKPPNMQVTLKFGKPMLEAQNIADIVVKRTLELLSDGLSAHQFNPGYPEMVLPAVGQLKLFCKKTRSADFRGLARALIERLQSQSNKVAQQRSLIDMAPRDVEAVDNFMAAERETAKLHRRRRMAEQAAAAERVAREAVTHTMSKLAAATAGVSSSDEESEADLEEEQAVAVSTKRQKKQAVAANGGGSEEEEAGDSDSESDPEVDEQADEVADFEMSSDEEA